MGFIFNTRFMPLPHPSLGSVLLPFKNFNPPLPPPSPPPCDMIVPKDSILNTRSVRITQPLSPYFLPCPSLLSSLPYIYDTLPTDPKDSIFNTRSVEFHGDRVVTTRYMDDFPFPYYVALQRLEALPVWFYPVNTPYAVNTPCRHTLLIHAVNTTYQHTLSTLPYPKVSKAADIPSSHPTLSPHSPSLFPSPPPLSFPLTPHHSPSPP